MRVFKKLNIALDHYNETSKSFLFARDISTVKEYVIFDTIEEFMIHINKNTYNHYYEIIYGIQRLYMDIDIPMVNSSTNINLYDKYIDELVQHIKSVYNTRINIYTSHTDKKLSYHIILRDIAVWDNIQCKAYIEKLISLFNMKNTNHPIIEFIDMKVYRPHQLLRLLGSTKMGKNNTKIIYLTQDSTLDHKENLLNSLVSYNIDKNIILPYINIEYSGSNIIKQAREFNITRKYI